MKRLFLLVISLVVINQLVSAQTWQKALERTNGDPKDVTFLDENNGWIVGNDGLVLQTNDGGLKWKELAKPAGDLNLYSVCFLDRNTGFVGADSGKFFSTNDGGNSWLQVTVGGPKSDLEEIYFSDASNGWIMASESSGGQVYRTTDGGNNWSLDLTAARDLHAMHFYAANKGIVTGKDVNNIYYTADGSSWQNASVSSLGGINYSRSDIYGVYMVNETTIHAVGWGSTAVGLEPTIHIFSSDGGANWEYMPQAVENYTYVNLYDIWFKDEMNGLAVGGSSSYFGSVLVKTTDAGVTWEEIDVPFGSKIDAITGIGDNVWAIGFGGLIAYSPDLGNTWQMISEIPSTTFYTLQFLGENTALAAGYGGLFAKSTDKGATWSAKYISENMKCPTINDVYFVNENVGYAARTNKMISKTVDGGQTWSCVMEGTVEKGFSHYGLSFINENLGLVVGETTDIDIVYKTTDGGTSWSEVSGFFNNELKDVHFIDENNAVVVGKGLTVGYSTDGGATWNNSTVQNVPSEHSTAELRDVTFWDASNGLAVGKKIVLHTVDGGKTWDYVEIPGLNKTMQSSYQNSALNWWVAGSKNVYETTDGGATWNDIADSDLMTSSLYTVTADKSGDIWVGASSSNIYTTSPVVSVDDRINSLPASYTLYQNYPNPFNPETIIKFTIRDFGFVVLKVYNLLGQEVATLLNENKQPGIYEIDFNAGELSSGIYLYSLKANEQTITRKMILLK